MQDNVPSRRADAIPHKRVRDQADDVKGEGQDDCKVNKQECCPQITLMNADEEEEIR